MFLVIKPHDWINAAIDMLADEGESGVAIEPLARRLGVTKGSFYHHFKDRDALWTALLVTFEAIGTENTIDEMSAIADPKERLLQLFEVAWDEPRHLRAQRALLSSRRPDVVTTLERIHARRRSYLVQCYLDIGYEPARASNLAAAAYAMFIGAIQLSGQAPFDESGVLRAWVDEVKRLLLPTQT